MENRRGVPYGRALVMALSFSGVLAMTMATLARVIMVAMGLDLLLRVLGS